MTTQRQSSQTGKEVHGTEGMLRGERSRKALLGPYVSKANVAEGIPLLTAVLREKLKSNIPSETEEVALALLRNCHFKGLRATPLSTEARVVVLIYAAVQRLGNPIELDVLASYVDMVNVDMSWEATIQIGKKRVPGGWFADRRKQKQIAAGRTEYELLKNQLPLPKTK